MMVVAEGFRWVSWVRPHMLVKAFSDVGLSQGVSINIQGTLEDPLFQANQIGTLLGLVNIRETIKDFDADEKDAVSTTDSIGRHQTILYLTELGLYRLLGMSRKPFARPFVVYKQHVCRGCLREARAGCCENYSVANRSKRFIIKNMELVAEDIPTDDDGGR